MTPDDIGNRFAYHKPTPLKAIAHARVRDNLLQMAWELNETLPESREKSLAITKLEEAMMWANAALARHE